MNIWNKIFRKTTKITNNDNLPVANQYLDSIEKKIEEAEEALKLIPKKEQMKITKRFWNGNSEPGKLVIESHIEEDKSNTE